MWQGACEGSTSATFIILYFVCSIRGAVSSLANSGVKFKDLSPFMRRCPGPILPLQVEVRIDSLTLLFVWLAVVCTLCKMSGTGRQVDFFVLCPSIPQVYRYSNQYHCVSGCIRTVPSLLNLLLYFGNKRTEALPFATCSPSRCDLTRLTP